MAGAAQLVVVVVAGTIPLLVSGAVGDPTQRPGPWELQR